MIWCTLLFALTFASIQYKTHGNQGNLSIILLYFVLYLLKLAAASDSDTTRNRLNNGGKS